MKSGMVIKALMLAGVALLGSPAFANPAELTFVGRLVDDGGKPLAGPVNLEAAFYRAADGGDPIGGVTLPFGNVTLSKGVFSIDMKLTDAEVQTIFNGTDDVYIQVTDKTTNKIYARQKYNSVPYALKVPIDNSTLVWDSDGKLMVGKQPSVGMNVPGGSGTVTLKPGSGSADGLTYTLPAAPIAGDFMTTDANGNMTWTNLTSQFSTLNASNLTTGTAPLARGGTGADLSATGGAGQYLKQSSSGGAVSVGTIPASDLVGTVPVSNLPTMAAATAGAAGTSGIVPAAAAGQQGLYLKGDGTWGIPSGSAAGTTGQVQFNNGGSFSTANGFIWDVANKRLGIGTTAPAGVLSVNTGAANAVGAIVKANAGQTADLTQWQDSTGAVLGKIDSNGVPTFASINLTGGNIPASKLDAGTGANQIVQLTGASKLPGVDGSLLTVLNGAAVTTGQVPAANGGTGVNSTATFPTSGVISVVAGIETLTNKTLTAPVITTVNNGGTVTIPAGTDTLVNTTNTVSLSNKTLITPTIASITNGGSVTVPAGTDTLVNTTNTVSLSNKTLITPTIASITNGGSVTVPAGTDTLVNTTNTLTLANKTLTAPVISVINNGGAISIPSGIDTIVTTTNTVTLFNKTISGLSLSGQTSTGFVNGSGSLNIPSSGTVTVPSGTDTLVNTLNAVSLSNKTLITPTIASITNGGTVTIPAGTDTLINTTNTVALTNKTLTGNTMANLINGGTVTIPAGTDTLINTTNTVALTNKTLTGNTMANLINGGTVTIPAGTDTLVTTTNTVALTNKTLTGNTMASLTNGGTVTIPAGTDTVDTSTNTLTLSNKTLSAPTIAMGTTSLSFPISGVVGTSDTILTRTNVTTLTGKTLSAPTIAMGTTSLSFPISGVVGTSDTILTMTNSATLTNKTLSAPTIAMGTTSLSFPLSGIVGTSDTIVTRTNVTTLAGKTLLAPIIGTSGLAFTNAGVCTLGTQTIVPASATFGCGTAAQQLIQPTGTVAIFCSPFVAQPSGVTWAAFGLTTSPGSVILKGSAGGSASNWTCMYAQ